MVLWQVRRLVAVAEYFQVELNGRYSMERIVQLAQYHRTSTLKRAVVVMIGTALPCLVVPVLLDILPLAEPTAGINSNGRFFVREGIMWWVLGFLAAGQFGHFVSALGLSFIELVFTALITSLGSTASTYALSTVIGFPLPFTMVMGAPCLVTLVTIGVGMMGGKRLRNSIEVRPQLVSLLKVWTCQCVLVGIYPGYFYIFTSLPSSYRLPFACMLPAIKVLVRNWLSRALVHLKDEMSEHVLLNADVFSALFVAYCMQTVPSVWTTAGLMSIDATQIIIAVRDLNRLSAEVESLRKQIVVTRAQITEADSKGIPNTPVNATNNSQTLVLDSSSAKSVLDLASAIYTHYLPPTSITVQKHTSENKNEPGLPSNKVLRSSLRRIVPGAIMNEGGYKYIRRVKRSEAPSSKHSRGLLVGSIILPLSQLERQLMDTAGRQLFFAEFLLLLNFVEVIIPVVYAISLLSMYFLTNRSYYAALKTLDEDKLLDTALNVMIYGLLELLSLIILCTVLSYKLKFSAPVQLAFVLERQWRGVQIKLVFWVLYSSQTLLEHFGFDYTFQFSWLHDDMKTTGSS